VQGLGGGGLLATGQVILLDAFPPAGRGVATALFGVGVTIGPLVGPVAGGWLTDNLSWPWIFFVNIPFGIAAVVMTRLFVPDGAGEATPEAAREPIDFPGVGLLAVGMGSLQAVLERGEQEDWLSSRLIVALIFCAALGLAAFAWRELTTAHPVLDLRLLRNRSLTAGALFAGVLGFGLYSTIFLLPVFLQSLQGYTPYESGLVQFGPAVFAVFSFMAAGLLSARQDPRILLGIGVALFILCPWGLSFLSPQTGDASLYGPLIARSAALGFLFVPLTVAPLGSLRPDERGAGSGIVNFMRQFGGSVGIAVMSTVLDRQRDYHRVWLTGHISSGSLTVRDWLHGTQDLLLIHGYAPEQARTGALELLSRTLERQVALLSFNDCFRLVAAVFLLALPLVFLFRKSDGREDIGSAH
jgi:DHA2 family multidrug resistance protein